MDPPGGRAPARLVRRCGAPWRDPGGLMRPGGFAATEHGERRAVLIRNNVSEHLPWIVACLVVTVLAIGWFVFACIGQSAYPSGSSLPGFTFGVVGGAICF